MPHPDDVPRPVGSYDPSEPIVIPYGDLIAARNAVAHLILVMTDEVDPPSQFGETASGWACGSAPRPTTSPVASKLTKKLRGG